MRHNVGYVSQRNNTYVKVRRKRFVEGYAKLNTTEYQESYTNKYKWTVEGEYAGEVDQQSLIGDMFTGLYMNLSKRARMDLGHQISDMLISCTFDEKQCNASMFELYQTSSYGNCWTISNKDFTAKQTGPKGGLSLIMFLEAGQYLKGFTTGYGVRVQIQKKGQVPFPFDEGLHAAASFETDIGMKLVSMTRLGGNYGSCNDGVEFSKKYGWEYSRRACQLDCLNTVIINTCGCFNEKTEGNEEFALAGNSDIKPCRWEREVRCLVNITRQYMNKTITCSCHDPCREFAYTKTVSQRQWPTAEYARVLLQSVCNRDPVVCKSLREDINNTQVLNNNFLKLNIYYEDLNYNNITESPQIETQQFLSDVGGAIGLWIGLSILSLCELIQLFVELCNYGIHRIGKGRRPETERYDRRGDRSYGDSNGKNIGKSNHSRGENGCKTHWREQGMSPHFDGRYGSRDFGSSDYDQYTDLGSAGGRRQGRFPHDLERDSRGDGRRHLR
ncbi:amiloride-sensitive sodium channel subunit alpha-like isoform X2 [Dreissena polymorpha]|uniref:amiloride-sensitive sodium channel subunit alpha-like isoform X2 n=1 Tax=Dreissena polymorpha TaxID=45954 RepID=UPI002264124A|nr:amiloride-sensitive sodium channel subunit alpha-like isoform X2 [Dreissena polymorpha]